MSTSPAVMDAIDQVGLSHEEIAFLLDLSPATVTRAYNATGPVHDSTALILQSALRPGDAPLFDHHMVTPHGRPARSRNTTRRPIESAPRFCPNHPWLALPLSGRCDDC